MDPVVVFIIAAAVVVIVVLVHRKNKHQHHGNGHHVLGSAGSLGATQSSNPPYTGDCLTNYLANKKAYGNDIATTVAKGCMLYSNPSQDPCGCAPAFADSIQGGSSIQSAAKVLKQCMEHNAYDCTEGEICPPPCSGAGCIGVPQPPCYWGCTSPGSYVCTN